MARRTSTPLGPAGVPVVRHSAGPGPEADAIRHEATVLALARGAGVVDLVATGDGPDGGAWLSTRYLGGGTLTDLLRSAGEPAATAALARVAGALADLHDRGIVHGRCTADHVVGGAPGASLCGFSAASVAESGRPPDTRVDERALAALVATTLTSDAETSRRARGTVTGLTSPSSGTKLRAVAAELWALARDAGWVEPAHGAGAPSRRHGDRGEGGRSARSPLARSRLRLGRLVVATTRSAGDLSTLERPPPDLGQGTGRLRPRRGRRAAATPDGGARLARHLGAGADRARPEPDAQGDRPDAPAPGRGTDGSSLVASPGADACDDRPPPARRRPRPRRRRHTAPPAEVEVLRPGRLAVVGAATAASVATLGGILLLGDGRPSLPPVPQAAPAAPPAPPASGPVEGGDEPSPPPSRQARTPAPARVWPRLTEAGPDAAPVPAPPAGGPAAPVAGPAPVPAPPTALVAPPVAGLAAPVVEHAGARYAIGLPGDLVVLGDWDCDGLTTPAVVRPADGSVWTFPSWTAGPEVLAAEPVTHAPAPVGAVSRSDTDGCDVLAITTADGDEVLVRPDRGERASGQ